MNIVQGSTFFGGVPHKACGGWRVERIQGPTTSIRGNRDDAEKREVKMGKEHGVVVTFSINEKRKGYGVQVSHRDLSILGLTTFLVGKSTYGKVSRVFLTVLGTKRYKK